MPTPPQLKAPFFPENFYHMVCKSIDGILLFNDQRDFSIYTKTFNRYTSPFLESWSFSLLNNHAHYVVRASPVNVIIEKLANESKQSKTVAVQSFLNDPGNEILFDRMIERQMNSFLVSYANYYNNKYQRQGGLFQKPFKRIHIKEEAHLQQAIIYVHANAQKHGVVRNFTHHKHSSYKQILNGDHSFVAGDSVIDFLGGKTNFEQLHKEQAEYYYKNNWPASKLE